MGNASTTVHCAKCGAAIDESPNTIPGDRKPCPVCGSTGRKFQVALEEKVEFHDSVRLKLKDAATGETKVDQFSGDDLHVKSGEWMKKERLIDREKDQYKEVVTDPETGQVIHHCDEPSRSIPATAPPRTLNTAHDQIRRPQISK